MRRGDHGRATHQVLQNHQPQGYLRLLSLHQKTWSMFSNANYQLRNVVSDVVLPQSWADQWLKFLERDELVEKQSSGTTIQNLKTEIQDLDRKQNTLLDSYLDSVVDPETYKSKKNEMFETKLKLQEEIVKVEETGSSWLEPMRNFVNCALQAQKIARAKNNCEELAFFAKRVGSNFFLSNRQLSAEHKKSFLPLPSPP